MFLKGLYLSEIDVGMIGCWNDRRWNKKSYLKARQENFKHRTFSLPFGLSPSPSQPMCIVLLHPAFNQTSPMAEEPVQP